METTSCYSDISVHCFMCIASRYSRLLAYAHCSAAFCICDDFVCCLSAGVPVSVSDHIAAICSSSWLAPHFKVANSTQCCAPKPQYELHSTPVTTSSIEDLIKTKNSSSTGSGSGGGCCASKATCCAPAASSGCCPTKTPAAAAAAGGSGDCCAGQKAKSGCC